MSKENKITVVLLVFLLVLASLYLFVRTNDISGSAVITNNQRHSSTPTIILDSNDIPHLTWYTYLSKKEYWKDIIYVKQVGSNWVTAGGEIHDNNNGNVSNDNENTSWESSVVLDRSNDPHFAWIVDHAYGNGNGSIRYVKWHNNNWLTEDDNIYNPL